MTAHRIKYEGPAAIAVRAATMLADAEGVELTSAEGPQHVEGQVDTVLLALTVESSTEAVTVAVTAIGAELPEARFTLESL